ncbi:MAG TPA: DUF4265 domain-containing protein [Methanosarcina sp.]|nr:DUF4265 domain-containing protein [Methanosarcina sp.]
MEHVKILFEHFNTPENEYGIESAWALPVGENFQLDNILFYAPEYSIGDIVSVEKRDGELFVTGLVQESGHSTVRVILSSKEGVAPLRDELKKLGCDSEISNVPILISVDIPPEVDYSLIKNLLVQGENLSKWSYEESCIAH